MRLTLPSKPSYDIIVIGAGPAGLTAGMYAASLNVKTLILKGSIPSRLSLAKMIYNYPGFPDGIPGKKLLELMEAQAVKMGAILREDDVVSLTLTSPIKTVITRRESLTARAIIIATGMQRAKLRISGEDEFLGRGVSYCVICDGPLYKGKDIVLIGQGDEAVRDVKLLSSIARKVLFIPLEPLKGNELAELETCNNIEILDNCKVKEIIGRDAVEGIKVELPEGEKIIKANGVFIVAREVPIVNILKKAGIKVDERGCIIVNVNQETNIKGVFAAGDCTCIGMQVSTAVGQGALAAINAVSYIRGLKR